jgi:hypothetical protein
MKTIQKHLREIPPGLQLGLLMHDAADHIDRLEANQITTEIRAVLDAADKWTLNTADDAASDCLLDAVDAYRAATPKDGE